MATPSTRIDGTVISFFDDLPTVGAVNVDMTVTADALMTFSDGSAGDVQLRGILTPQDANDAVPKSYVDGLINGVSWKDPAIVSEPTAEITIATPGDTFDGVTLTTGPQRILLLAQTTTPAENGIWVWTDAVTALTRPDDFASGSSQTNAALFVATGNTNADKAFVSTADPPNNVVDTDNLAFIQFSTGVFGPGGNDTEVQFNNSGVFGGISGITTNGSTLGVSTSVNYADSAAANFGTDTDMAITHDGTNASITNTTGDLTTTTSGTLNLIGDDVSVQPVTGQTVFRDNGDTTDLVTILGASEASTSTTTGTVRVDGGIGATGRSTFPSVSIDAGSGNNTLITSQATSADVVFDLPENTGTAGQFLQTDGAGVLSFASVTGLTATEDAVTASTAEITVASPGATIGGFSPSVGDVILLLGQAAGDVNTPDVENGLWEYQGAAVAMTRTVTNFTTSDSVVNFFTFVSGGTEAGKSFIQTSDPAIVDTDALVYSTFSGATPAAGNNGNIQFNNAGSFGGSDTFNFNGTNVMSVGDATAASTFNIEGADQTTADTAGTTLAVSSGAGDGTGAGGDLTIVAGDGGGTTGDGGDISIKPGNTTGGSTGQTVFRDAADTTNLVTVLGASEASTTTTTGTMRVDGGVGATGQVTGASLAVLDGTDTFYNTIDTAATTDWTLTLPVDGGTANFVLQTDGSGTTSWVDPSSFETAPAAPDFSIQFNDGAGAFGGASTFLFNGTDTVTLGAENSTFNIVGEAVSSVAGVGANVSVAAGSQPAGGNTGDGGDLTLAAGDALGTGGGTAGNVIINAGDNVTPDAGGNITLSPGENTGTGDGGNLLVVPGNTVSGTAGQTTFRTAADDADLVSILGVSENSTSTTTGTVRIVGGLGITQDAYATTFNAISDATLKKDIQPISDALNKILAIEGYTYNWKDESKNTGKRQIGFLAQQLEEAGLDNVVNGNDQFKAVNYAGVVPLIIEAIKELVHDIYE